jgi:hypothetical protein
MGGRGGAALAREDDDLNLSAVPSPACREGEFRSTASQQSRAAAAPPPVRRQVAGNSAAVAFAASTMSHRMADNSRAHSAFFFPDLIGLRE